MNLRFHSENFEVLHLEDLEKSYFWKRIFPRTLTSLFKRVEKKHQHFFHLVTSLNQRKLPSATRVSKEIETEFRSSFFPEVTEVFAGSEEFV